MNGDLHNGGYKDFSMEEELPEDSNDQMSLNQMSNHEDHEKSHETDTRKYLTTRSSSSLSSTSSLQLAGSGHLEGRTTHRRSCQSRRELPTSGQTRSQQIRTLDGRKPSLKTLTVQPDMRLPANEPPSAVATTNASGETATEMKKSEHDNTSKNGRQPEMDQKPETKPAQTIEQLLTPLPVHPIKPNLTFPNSGSNLTLGKRVPSVVKHETADKEGILSKEEQSPVHNSTAKPLSSSTYQAEEEVPFVVEPVPEPSCRLDHHLDHRMTKFDSTKDQHRTNQTKSKNRSIDQSMDRTSGESSSSDQSMNAESIKQEPKRSTSVGRPTSVLADLQSYSDEMQLIHQTNCHEALSASSEQRLSKFKPSDDQSDEMLIRTRKTALNSDVVSVTTDPEPKTNRHLTPIADQDEKFSPKCFHPSEQKLARTHTQSNPGKSIDAKLLASPIDLMAKSTVTTQTKPKPPPTPPPPPPSPMSPSPPTQVQIEGSVFYSNRDKRFYQSEAQFSLPEQFQNKPFKIVIDSPAPNRMLHKVKSHQSA